jgi:hypothetical protein
MQFSYNYKDNYKSKHSVSKFMSFSTADLLPVSGSQYEV